MNTDTERAANVSAAIRKHGPLILDSIEENWSFYLDRGAAVVCLAHTTGIELVAFEDLEVADLWVDWCRTRILSTFEEFLDHLETLTYEPDEVESVKLCLDCSRVALDVAMNYVNDESHDVCDSCFAGYSACNNCDERFRVTTHTLHGERVCSSCRSSYLFCNHCDGWWHPESEEDHDHDENGEGCCASPALEFSVRNDGGPALVNGERVTITLPAGVIDDEGIGAISVFIRTSALDLFLPEEQNFANQPWMDWQNLSYAFLDEVGAMWQGKRGNFTKRLSRFAHQKYGISLPPEVISGVGNIASDHSRAVDVTLEVSRDLNVAASEWFHEGSCWFGGGEYGESRCVLKTNGGYGLRTFSGSRISGRAWVMPLRVEDSTLTPPKLTPTFETLDPDAFIVFNAYGDLEGYAAARIVAHMAGMTYRKVDFECSGMYVNSDSGYLVAPEALAKHYTDGDLYLSARRHSDLWNREQMQVVTEPLGPVAEKELEDVPF